MLCPKCGFISFDHFAACVKCHNDLSQIGADLQGTATDAACRHFLGLVLNDESAPQKNQPAIDEASDASTVTFEQEEKVEEAGPEDAFGAEDVAMAFPADESPALEFDLDEIPHLDISGFRPVEGDAESAMAAGAPEETGTTQRDLGKGKGGERDKNSPQPPPTEDSLLGAKPEISDDSLDIDTLSLSLDSVQSSLAGGSVQYPPAGYGDSDEEIVHVGSQPSTEGEPSEQLTIDLDEIDLSDLVHSQSEAVATPGDAGGAVEKRGLDFEDTMDLSLFVGDVPDAAVAPARLPNDSGIEPIDLTLMDEALIELAVEPGRKEPSFQKEAPAGEFELSMEDSHK